MTVLLGFVGFKGGSGKTLLAFQMAERAVCAGYRVVLWDLDPEQSAMHHMEWRAESGLPLWRAEAKRVDSPPENELDLPQLEDVDLIVCDCPGYNTFFSVAYMDRMDLLVAPLSTSAQDRTVMTRMGWMAQDRNWDLVFLPNNPRPSRTRLSGLIEDLESADFQVAPIRIGRWVALQDSSELGMGICEYEPEGQAARDIKELWAWLASRLELDTR